MGNRAVITTKDEQIGIYLHWNGGRDSVEAFLAACDKLGHRSPSDSGYGWARLCQVIGNYLGGSLSLGVDVYSRLDYDNGDNGTYIIEDWKIIDRKHFSGVEQLEYDLDKMVADILEKQPKQKE